MNTIYNVAYAQPATDGSNKSHWLNCGVLVVKEDGKMSLKLNCLPVGECTGWFGVFEKTDEPRKGKSSPSPADADVEF